MDKFSHLDFESLVFCYTKGMKLTTLNLQGFTDWAARQPAILDYLRRTNADIIFFQEAVFLPELSPFNQAQLLNQTLQYPYEHSSITRLQVGLEYQTFREGLVVLSKFPIVKTDAIILKKAPHDELNRIIQLVDVVMGDQIIKLANIHFSITDVEDFATAHLEETLSILRGRQETRLIAGDFNLDSLDASAPLWQDEYTTSATIPYISYPQMAKRNDYILIPKHDVFRDMFISGDSLSDHRALTVDITLT